jgi:predicted ArsR family transcriptional regulator
MTQLDLDWTQPRYPSVPGWKRTDTSREAADAIAPAKAVLQAKVLAALRDFGPLTADQCAFQLDIDKLSIRPRFTELKATGMIFDTGGRRFNGSGRRAIVWALVR